MSSHEKGESTTVFAVYLLCAFTMRLNIFPATKTPAILFSHSNFSRDCNLTLPSLIRLGLKSRTRHLESHLPSHLHLS